MKAYPTNVGFWGKVHPNSIFSGQINFHIIAWPHLTWMGFPVSYPVSPHSCHHIPKHTKFPPSLNSPTSIPLELSCPFICLKKIFPVHQLRPSWNESLISFPGLPYPTPLSMTAESLTSHLCFQSTYITHVSLSQCIVICVHVHIWLTSRQSFLEIGFVPHFPSTHRLAHYMA